ncbi:unnamed protein product [Haemonchus placei]|uniref:Leishmanolysin-like peptidase n=1 Tax=Haemonchus placei TaxID=6290 RepID=A0A0N4VZ23_HAEPC|nr:unnamed protein product [Haemonchus placei]
MGLVPNVLDQFTRVDWETSKGSVKHDVYMITTPRVREEARRHFNCSTLEGAEVENQGMPGTLGIHWEKRVFELVKRSSDEGYIHSIATMENKGHGCSLVASEPPATIKMMKMKMMRRSCSCMQHRDL